jgi:hypothetical protein
LFAFIRGDASPWAAAPTTLPLFENQTGGLYNIGGGFVCETNKYNPSRRPAWWWDPILVPAA